MNVQFSKREYTDLRLYIFISDQFQLNYMKNNKSGALPLKDFVQLKFYK